MHKKITRFARAVKCGALGANGFFSAASAHNPANAKYPKPDETFFNISRREQPICPFKFIIKLDSHRRGYVTA
jgi:hypothetical protein